MRMAAFVPLLYPGACVRQYGRTGTYMVAQVPPMKIRDTKESVWYRVARSQFFNSSPLQL